MKAMRLLMLMVYLHVACAGSGQKIVINGELTDRKLTWADFTGKVKKHSSFWAYTAYRIIPTYGDIKTFGDSISVGKFEVTLLLDPKRSWAKPDRITDELLAHEQGHFNIGILCMREIQAVYKQTKFTSSNINSTMRQIINDALKKYDEMGIRYDEETEHFRNREQQAKWNLFFEEQLK